jgi:hypothetical protein
LGSAFCPISPFGRQEFALLNGKESSKTPSDDGFRDIGRTNSNTTSMVWTTDAKRLENRQTESGCDGKQSSLFQSGLAFFLKKN